MRSLIAFLFSIIVVVGCSTDRDKKINHDSKYERLLVNVSWEYKSGLPDCANSDWGMKFKSNRKLSSYGGDCEYDDAWWFEAYGWYVKDSIIFAYIKPSADKKEPTLIAYPIISLEEGVLVINNYGDRITFVAKN